MRNFKLIFFTMFIFQTTLSYSQSDKEMEAIVNYQLAEEAYENKAYDKALNYLEEAKKIMGNKPKLLFFQIVIEIEKTSNDSNSLNKLLGLISTFEKSKDINNFPEEKRLIVSKNKVILKERLAQVTAKEIKEKRELEEIERKTKIGKENFEKFTIDSLPFGLTIEEFQKQYPNIFPEKYKIIKLQTYDIYYSKGISFEDKNGWLPYSSSTGNPYYETTINAIIVKDGKVIGFQKNLFYYNSKGQGNLDWNNALIERNNYYKKFVELFGSEPKINNPDYWSWYTDNKSISLFADVYNDPKKANRWKCSLMIRVVNF